MSKTYYHVVTERPMELGQEIIFDENHFSGVYERVYNLFNVVEDIYSNPDKYKNAELDHHLKVALRELALEEVRKKKYPNYPSRLASLYVSNSLEEAESWYKYFISLGRPTFQIVKVSVDGNSFTGDACNCFDGSTNKDKNIELAKKYWEGKDNDIGKTPIYETIIDGNIEVIDIIEEVNSFDRRSSVCDDYNLIADQYSLEFGTELDDLNFIKKIMSYLDKESSIIDLGGGTGKITNYLINNNYDAICYDFSEKMRDNALKLFPDIPYILDDIINISNHFNNNSIDCFIFMYSLFHIPRENIEKLFSDISNILKNNGLFCFSI